MRREREEYRKERRTVSPGRKKEARFEVIEKQVLREIVIEIPDDLDSDQSNVSPSD